MKDKLLLIISLLVCVFILISLTFNKREFTMQYKQNNKLITEVFKSTEDFNKRAYELKQNNIEYVLINN